MGDKIKEPQIRFNGFSDTWEQCKLGDTVTYVKGFAFKSIDYQEDGTRIIRVSDLSKDDIKEDVNKIFMSKNRAHEFEKYCINVDDIIITTVGSKAEMKESAVGRPIIMKRDKHYLLNQNLVKLTAKHNSYGPFLYNSLLSQRYTDYMAMIERGNANQANIAISDLWEYQIFITSLEEQKQIGSFFQNLDNLITLQQCKLEYLKEIKKSLLKKMFPNQGKDIPDLRFIGFTDAWEQCKLGELAIFNPKEELPNEFEYVDLESVVGTEMLSHRIETKATAPSRAQRLAHTGDLFYQTVRPYQKNNYLFEKPDKHFVFSTGYAQMRPFVDGYFLLSLVQNERFVKNVLDNCTGTSYPAINANDLADIEVHSPLDENEHSQIGTFFRNLDTLITLQQSKCDKFINIKKSLLGKCLYK